MEIVPILGHNHVLTCTWSHPSKFYQTLSQSGRIPLGDRPRIPTHGRQRQLRHVRNCHHTPYPSGCHGKLPRDPRGFRYHQPIGCLELWWLNSLMPSDAIGRPRFGSTSALCMACFLVEPCDYPNLIKGVSLHWVALRARIENQSTLENVCIEKRYNKFRIWSRGKSCQSLKFVVE